MKEMSTYKSWHAHRHCVICGQQNVLGLKIHFQESGTGEVEAEWKVTERLQGYTGLLQGGVTAALLDSAMVNALRYQGTEAFTAEMNVRYIRAIPVGAKLRIQGKVLRSRRNLHWTEATVFINEDAVAYGTAKFMTIDSQA